MYFSGSNNNNNVTKEDSGAVVVTPSGGGGGDQPLDLSVRSSKPSQPLSTTHIVNHHHESNQVQDENRNLIISEEPQTGTYIIIKLQEAMENFVFPDEIETKLMKMRKLMNIFYVP